MVYITNIIFDEEITNIMTLWMHVNLVALNPALREPLLSSNNGLKKA